MVRFSLMKCFEIRMYYFLLRLFPAFCSRGRGMCFLAGNVRHRKRLEMRQAGPNRCIVVKITDDGRDWRTKRSSSFLNLKWGTRNDRWAHPRLWSNVWKFVERAAGVPRKWTCALYARIDSRPSGMALTLPENTWRSRLLCVGNILQHRNTKKITHVHCKYVYTFLFLLLVFICM